MIQSFSNQDILCVQQFAHLSPDFLFGSFSDYWINRIFGLLRCEPYLSRSRNCPPRRAQICPHQNPGNQRWHRPSVFEPCKRRCGIHVDTKEIFSDAHVLFICQPILLWCLWSEHLVSRQQSDSFIKFTSLSLRQFISTKCAVTYRPSPLQTSTPTGQKPGQQG